MQAKNAAEIAQAAAAQNCTLVNPKQHKAGLRSAACVFADSLTRAQTIPCLQTGRRHRALPHGDENINVNVFFPESQDNIMLTVNLCMRVGPDEQDEKRNRFVDMFGDMAQTKFCERVKNKFDFGAPAGGRWDPSQTLLAQIQMSKKPPAPSLKNKIQDIAGIPLHRQKLSFRKAPMNNDSKTLRDYYIGHGCTIQCYIARAPEEQRKQDPLLLACTERRRRQLAKPEKAELSPRGCFNLRKSPAMKSNRADGGYWLMPKWIHEESPKKEGPNGPAKTVGISVQEFGSVPIAYKDFSHPAYGPGGSRINDIRAGPIFKQRLRNPKRQ